MFDDYIKDKFMEVFNKTPESDLRYDGKIKHIDFFSLLCKASSNNQMVQLLNSNICMFNYRYEDEDAVLIICAIPVNLETNEKKKHISERVIEAISLMEECLVKLDFIQSDSTQINEDKFTYIVAIKKLNK